MRTSPRSHAVRAAVLGTAAATTLGLAGCSSNNDTSAASSTGPAPSATSAPAGGSTPESTAPQAGPTTGDAGGDKAGAVTKKQAGKIVTDKYGGTVKSVESDHENGEETWEVEVKNSSKGRIEVDVSKKTGKIVSFEHD